MRYFFHIGYLGRSFNGWQKHPKVYSIQEVIEQKLSEVFKTPLTINGCGRTDSGVNASQFFFHVDLEREWDFDLKFRLNKLLPHSIAIFDIIPVGEKAHARFDAVQRRYDYFIHTKKDPFLGQLSSYYDLKELNVKEMRKAVDLLPQYHDYRAFCTSPDKNEHTLCYVKEAKLYSSNNGNQLRFQISSNRFLGKMIRIITGKLLKIGQGAMTVAEFEALLITKTIPPALEPAFPTGLYLSKVTYPYLDLPPVPDFGGLHHAAWEEVVL
ncbi:MAG: tRNA pseudouridine(38-40) synthase TruA [Pedobacter sp.]|nr:tRNA pseudouridine(38-40) synthase TruA [Pedobacter sp.]MDQ8053793.1 tRNA pseudouridine(38-40) synthase TruA [Pedobacter sp.]